MKLQLTFILLGMLGCCMADVLRFEQNGILQSILKGIKDGYKEEEVNDILKSAEEIVEPEAPVGKPWYCHDLSCPTFTVIENETDYQLREYDASSWVTTDLTGVDFTAAQYTMFMKLFGYISGKNDKGVKIKMTCPVIVRIIPGQGPTCENNFTMSFFNVPNKTPPTPTDKDVEITALPKLRAYVRSFGGMPAQKDWIAEAAKLAASLPDTASYVQDFYYTGGYDAPFTLFHRHNEIWFIAN